MRIFRLSIVPFYSARIHAPIIKHGFSLIEILVSLFIVSFAAVNILTLQKMVGDQSRDNFAHLAVIGLVNEKFTKLLDLTGFEQLERLNSRLPESVLIDQTIFELNWTVTEVAMENLASEAIRKVKLNIKWKDSTWRQETNVKQQFASTRWIFISQLVKAKSVDEIDLSEFPNVIGNLLATNRVNYFEPNTIYKKDAYVIYNSQLFQSTSDHYLGAVQQKNNAPIHYNQSVASISQGWSLVGRIDDPSLAILFTK